MMLIFYATEFFLRCSKSRKDGKLVCGELNAEKEEEIFDIRRALEVES